jgi:hypothetical protein
VDGSKDRAVERVEYGSLLPVGSNFATKAVKLSILKPVRALSTGLTSGKFAERVPPVTQTLPEWSKAIPVA